MLAVKYINICNRGAPIPSYLCVFMCVCVCVRPEIRENPGDSKRIYIIVHVVVAGVVR